MIQSLVKLKSENSYFSSGWIFVNKPKNVSSFDVIRRLKKIFSIKRIGHAGTLDPLATGILPIAFGSATKTIPYLVSSKKENVKFYSISYGLFIILIYLSLSIPPKYFV